MLPDWASVAMPFRAYAARFRARHVPREPTIDATETARRRVLDAFVHDGYSATCVTAAMMLHELLLRSAIENTIAAGCTVHELYYTPHVWLETRGRRIDIGNDIVDALIPSVLPWRATYAYHVDQPITRELTYQADAPEGKPINPGTTVDIALLREAVRKGPAAYWRTAPAEVRALRTRVLAQ